jgi:hypothetical protein
LKLLHIGCASLGKITVAMHTLSDLHVVARLCATIFGRFSVAGIRKIDPCVYADFADAFFGLESASRLQLCAMDLPKDEQTGYYHIAHEVKLF